MKKVITTILAIGIGIIIGWLGGTVEGAKVTKDAVEYYNRYCEDKISTDFFEEMIHKAIDYPLE